MDFRSGCLWFLLCGCLWAWGGGGCSGSKKSSLADGAIPFDGPVGAGGSATGGSSGMGSGGAPGSGGLSSGGTASAGTGGAFGTGGLGTAVATGGLLTGGAAGFAAGGTFTGGTAGASTGGMPGSGGVGTGGALGGAGGALVSCPTTPPSSGSACAGPYGDAGSCTWGDNPRAECRTRGVCNSGAWSIVQPPAYCAGLATSCPSASPVESSACSDTSSLCLYGETLCDCTPCTGRALGDPAPFCPGQPLGTLVWHCTATSAMTAPCPATIPNRGAPCTVDSTIGCPSDNCGGLNVHCTGGVWTWTYPAVDCARSWCASKCSVCASPDTPIATPDGDRPIADLHVGDRVYTVEDDAIRAVPILRATRTPVAAHHVVRVETVDGRVLEVSPGHPTADGRTFGDLRPGSRLDGAAVLSVEIVPYRHPYTYDILPLSRSGSYFAAGMLIGTTLR